MALPPVAAGDPHAAAHNNERTLINNLQNVTDPTFKDALDAEIAIIAPVESVNGQIGTVVLDASDVGASTPAEVVAASTEDRKRENHSGTQPAASINDLLEAVQDILGSSIAAGSNMTMSYNDATGIITLSAVVDGAAINTDPEVVRDTIGNALVGAGLIGVTVNDAGDTITISTSATQNRTDAATDLLLADKLDKTKLNGGATGQALVKTSADDQDYAWGDVASGGFDPSTYKGVYSSDLSYLAGESVLLDGKVYVANNDLAAAAGERAADLVGSWSADVTTNTQPYITVPPGAVQEGDLLFLVSMSGNASAYVTSPWNTVMFAHPNGGYMQLSYRYATAADVVAGFSVYGGGLGVNGSSAMVKAYRGGKFFNLNEVRMVPGTINPAAATNPLGRLRDRLQVNMMIPYTATSFTVTSGWAGVTDYVTSEVSPFDYFSVHSADKAVSKASTDWAALTGFAVSGSTGNMVVFQANIYNDLDPTDWTYSEALTKMLAPQSLLASMVRDTAGAASTFYTTSSTTVVAIDATNLAVTFVAPDSGKVRIDASLVAYVSAAGIYGFFGLLDGAGAYVPGSSQMVAGVVSPGSRFTPHWLIEGLTPGVTYTYKLGFGVSSGSMSVAYGGNNTGSSVGTGILGPIQMEAWRA